MKEVAFGDLEQGDEFYFKVSTRGLCKFMKTSESFGRNAVWLNDPSNTTKKGLLCHFGEHSLVEIDDVPLTFGDLKVGEEFIYYDNCLKMDMRYIKTERERNTNVTCLEGKYRGTTGLMEDDWKVKRA